jgi:hypothetical protein
VENFCLYLCSTDLAKPFVGLEFEEVDRQRGRLEKQKGATVVGSL